MLYNNEYLTVRVTREEFETASRELLMRTIEATKKMFERHSNQKPETIILTGGASQMPMVKRALEEAFPEYKGDEMKHRKIKSRFQIQAVPLPMVQHVMVQQKQ